MSPRTDDRVRGEGICWLLDGDDEIEREAAGRLAPLPPPSNLQAPAQPPRLCGYRRPVVPKDDTHLIDCPMTPWTGDTTTCRWCDSPLSPDQPFWCSQTCGRQWRINHRWRSGREVVIKRDEGRCTRCGYHSDDAFQEAKDFFHLMSLTIPARIPPFSLHARIRKVATTWFMEDPWRLCLPIVRKGIRRMEVHHIDPALGRYREDHCIHHLDDLTLLCSRCHGQEDRLRRATVRSKTTLSIAQ